jgi:hypothetical protein
MCTSLSIAGRKQQLVKASLYDMVAGIHGHWCSQQCQAVATKTHSMPITSTASTAV